MDRLEWLAADKAIDPDFAGSLWEQMGFENRICPTCKSHLRNGICLNACHLGDDGKWRFEAFMDKVAKEKKTL